MKKWYKSVSLLAFVAVLLSSVVFTLRVDAHRPSPDREPTVYYLSPGRPPVPGAEWSNGMIGHLPNEAPNQGSTAQSTPGPDDYGYRWDGSETFDWVDTSGGTDAIIDNNTEGVGPIPLPFAFKFYENTYNEVYISRYGYITFSDYKWWYAHEELLTGYAPDNVIAPYWTYLDVGSSGRVKYESFGTSPNRYFVVTWYRMRDYFLGTFTFQVVLHENGDIVFQYKQMDCGSGCSWAGKGIEDSRGTTGLGGADGSVPPSETAVCFIRPPAQARVRIDPEVDGTFSSAGEVEEFDVLVHNWGDLGSDTYDVTVDSGPGWNVSLYKGDGTTPLEDTDGDGIPDVGNILENMTTTIVAKVKIPDGVKEGESGEVDLTFKSSLETSKSKTAKLYVTIPAPFAEVYQGESSSRWLALNRPEGQTQYPLTSGYGEVNVVTEKGWPLVVTSIGSRSLSNGVYVDEIYYKIVDHKGSVVRGTKRLTDLSGATENIGAWNVQTSISPKSGYIGIVWIWQNSSQYNISWAVLDKQGKVIHGPEVLYSLSSSNGWLSSPSIAATEPDRFAIAWHEGVANDLNLHYQIRDANGDLLRDSVLDDEISVCSANGNAHLVRLSNGNILLIWSCMDGGEVGYSIVMNGDGQLLSPPYRLPYDLGWIQDAAILPNGRILVTGWNWGDKNLPFMLLAADGRSAVAHGKSPLPVPDALTCSQSSIAPDSHGHVVITCSIFGGKSNRQRVYFLLNGDGNLVHPATVYGRGYLWWNQHAASLDEEFADVPTGNWAQNWIQRMYVDGITGGCRTAPLRYCPDDPVTRAQMAVFLEKGMHYPDTYSPPDVGPTFPDTAGHWAEDWIEALKSDGITSGFPDGTYRPESPVTRAQMAVFLLKAKHGASYQPPAVDRSRFSDVHDDHWAKAWIEELAAEGITSGYPDGTYRPQNPVTRAEMSVFLVKTFDLP